jgi:TRAP-type transport system periplasmic protein
LASQRASRSKFAAGSLAALATIGSVKAPARAAQFTLKCGSQQPLDHPSSVRLTQMWKAIERESGGRMHTDFFPNSMLGGESAMLNQVRVGALDFFLTATGNISSIVPSADVTNIGFAFNDDNQAFHVMDGPLGAYLFSEIESKGLYPLRLCWGSGMKHVGSNSHPIRVPEDFHGFKIKVVGKLAVDLFRTLGANPVPMSFGELYTALQTKLVDGEDNPLVTIESGRIYEVNKYVSLTNHAYSAFYLITSQDLWKKLPPDIQAIVERNNRKYGMLERKDTLLVAASVGDKLKRQGLILNAVDQAPFRAQLHSYYEGIASAFGSTEWALLQSALGRRLT